MSDALAEAEPFRTGLFRRSPFRLLGSRCDLCAHVTYPIRSFCPRCRRGRELTEIELSARGEIHTFTVVRQAPPGTEVPYVLAQVLLPEGCRVMATCVAEEGHAYAIGDVVELEPMAMLRATGPDAVGYRFRVIPRESS
ncbi:Zn-ribbon domain-containing OB-fold protein [Streptomyces melanosporofaciens]|uniref:Rubredoxin-like zinc ribbon domain n=1 Tax=Streptomyces melanosporofaciens TaxID=67327 RepID=A0A1H4I8R6_STRMJ|nr:Zn-ribbon domain-containing OB-fold protein [Streptomyces melanosporofaciens]SEB30381.1 Rubredoxin-like zinc ribbon domain [Streptomyces melanosporofaciens]